jgi:hypothetical protein
MVYKQAWFSFSSFQSLSLTCVEQFISIKMVQFIDLLQVIVSKSKKSLNKVKLVKVQDNNWSDKFIHVGKFSPDFPGSKFMVSLSAKEVEFFLDKLPKLFGNNSKLYNHTLGNRYLIIKGKQNGEITLQQSRLNSETFEENLKEVTFYSREIRNILTAVKALRYFQSPGNQNDDWVLNVSQMIFLKLVEKEMKKSAVNFEDAYEKVKENQKLFNEAMKKVLLLFDYPEAREYTDNEKWLEYTANSSKEISLDFFKEKQEHIFIPICFVLDEEEFEYVYKSA